MKYFHRGNNSQADMITVIHNLLADACINFNIRSHKLKQENCKASHKTKVHIESFISTILQKNSSMKIIYFHWLAVISKIAVVMQTLSIIEITLHCSLLEFPIWNAFFKN